MFPAKLHHVGARLLVWVQSQLLFKAASSTLQADPTVPLVGQWQSAIMQVTEA
jgi:hypothetical protein